MGTQNKPSHYKTLTVWLQLTFFYFKKFSVTSKNDIQFYCYRDCFIDSKSLFQASSGIWEFQNRQWAVPGSQSVLQIVEVQTPLILHLKKIKTGTLIPLFFTEPVQEYLFLPLSPNFCTNLSDEEPLRYYHIFIYLKLFISICFYL